MTVLEAEQKKKIEGLETEIRILSLKVKDLEQQIFGSKADKRPPENPNQQTLGGFEETEQAEPEEPGSPPRKRRSESKGKKKGPKKINPDLPRVDESVPDPELKDLICPITGKPMKRLFPETIEVLACKPREYFVRRITRWVHGLSTGDSLAYSPWPANVLPKSRIDVSIIASLASSRFADHQPYHRQSKQLKRQGVELATSTMVSLIRQACEKMDPVYKEVAKQCLKTDYLMMDPTPVPLMTNRKKGSTKEACLWTYRALDGPVFFEYSDTKAGKTPAKTLENYQGILQTDGASNFGGVPSRDGVTHLNCWAHVRRYFVKAECNSESLAKGYVDSIDRLFRIERLARHFKLGTENLRKLRERHSLPIVDETFEAARKYAEKEIMRKTPLPKAINYMLGRTKELRECFLHQPSRIDNNLAENALRPIKLGARNWLFIGHENGGPWAALMFTLVENCRMLGINPEEYLADILARVDDHPASQIHDLTPHGWAEAKKKSKNK